MRKRAPFLEVLTRCYARPESLKVNQASLDAQTDADWQQTMLVDDVGRGVAWANRNLGAYGPQLVGDYIWILDDDDECVRPTLVAELKAIVAEHHPDVIMLRTDCGNYGVLPPDDLWGHAPRYTQVSMSNFVVRREIWQAYAGAFPLAQAGDYAFVHAVVQGVGLENVYWHDVLAMRIQWKGGGRPESRKPVGERMLG